MAKNIERGGGESLMEGIIPNIKEWYFIYSKDGNPVQKGLVKKIFAELKKTGSVDLTRFSIGISGKTKDLSGNKIPVNGIHSQILRLEQNDDGSIKVLTATYQEYIAGEPASFKEADYLASATRMKMGLI